jgi:hypothetical protein
MTTKGEARGIRNNNPGNIRWGDEWQGLVSAEKRTDKDFCQFTTPEHGIRAIVVILLNYGKKPGQNGIGNTGIDTVREVISRWAPPNENNTEAYINAVAKKVGVAPNTPIMLRNYLTMKAMVESIITHENGKQPYSNEQIDRGIKLAGL